MAVLWVNYLEAKTEGHKAANEIFFGSAAFAALPDLTFRPLSSEPLDSLNSLLRTRPDDSSLWDFSNSAPVFSPPKAATEVANRACVTSADFATSTLFFASFY